MPYMGVKNSMDQESDTSSCDAKLAFDTKQQAQAVAVTSKYQRGDKPKLKVYRCQHCRLWHLATDYDTE